MCRWQAGVQCCFYSVEYDAAYDGVYCSALFSISGTAIGVPHDALVLDEPAARSSMPPVALNMHVHWLNPALQGRITLFIHRQKKVTNTQFRKNSTLHRSAFQRGSDRAMFDGEASTPGPSPRNAIDFLTVVQQLKVPAQGGCLSFDGESFCPYLCTHMSTSTPPHLPPLRHCPAHQANRMGQAGRQGPRKHRGSHVQDGGNVPPPLWNRV